MLLALLEEHTAALVERFAAAPGDGPSFGARLEGRLGRILAYQDAHRPFFAVVIDYGLIGPSSGASAMVLKGRRPRQIDRLRREVVALMAEGIDEGVLQPRLGPLLLGRVLVGVLRALTQDALLAGEGRAVDRAADVVEVFMKGSAAKRSRQP